MICVRRWRVRPFPDGRPAWLTVGGPRRNRKTRFVATLLTASSGRDAHELGLA